ncbi:hypothetical protein P9265_00840 [Schinkia azotoformans]|uniref:hypothetical protein n=1 Tax=Schinkia azotoformans TaxID=1454 RepID=UPI002E1F29A2|nr:hypothetical protein [Schinkia azotoformans]
MTTTTKNANFESLILHELIVNRIRRFEANLYSEDQGCMDTTYDQVIVTLSMILGKHYNVSLSNLSDFIDQKIYPIVQNGYNTGTFISSFIVDMFIYELGQKVDYCEKEFENIV